ncbi:MAG: DUF1653 domain-containing protein [Eubacterium sp.]|nr:DUF1653 domain-containing protein [Eubacterium sp.]
MPQGNPKPGERYLHFKNKPYQIVCLAHHSETDERLVVYQALYGDFGICARPYDMFISEVDHEKYPEVTQKYRFQYVETDNKQPYWAREEKPVEVPAKEAPVKMAVEPKEVFEPITLDSIKKADVVIRENLPKEDRIIINVDKMEHREFEPVKNIPPIVIEREQQAVPAAETAQEPEEGQANPWLIKFLDAETFDQKYEVLGQMYRDIDDKLIDDIAVCMDVVIPAGNLQERFMQLKQCIRTRQRYEGTRL